LRQRILYQNQFSLKIFCYEHEDFQTLSRPSQILPIGILWYDLKEKFSSELTPTPQESQQRNTKNIKLTTSFKPKPKPLPKPIPKPNPPLQTGTWNDLPQESPIISTTHTTPTKYPSQLMLPYSSLYTSFSNSHRDPRLLKITTSSSSSSSETIPLSPQRSQTVTEKQFPLIDIPLNSITPLIDPRLKTVKQTQNIFYLESNAVKHALQQQKRLNNYYDSKNGSTPKTKYTLIPFHIHSTSSNKSDQTSKHSFHMNYSSLYISVIDCFHFGFKKSNNQLYVDLEQNENQLAYEQMKISNQLIHHEKKLNSQEIRLHVREQRQRKIEEQMNEQRKNDLLNSKIYINNGRKLLKEHQEVISSTNNQISLELLDFFSYEYRNENRPHVKRILAELIGVFVEKYGLEQKEIMSQNKTIEGKISSLIRMSVKGSFFLL
jgi:hypothetical protein